MPSAGIDPGRRARFIAEYEALLSLAGLPESAPVGVALSGGPDSVALVMLTASCAIGPVHAITVDHGLRAESAAEAETVGKIAAYLDVPHTIVRVSVTSGGDGLQGEARRARYAALADCAQMHGLACVLTAHHADDQAETMLMRLARGSGLGGLVGIRPVRPFDESRPDGPLLLRPLLGWRKTELEAIVATAGIEPVRDPSNADQRFDRTAARGLLAEATWLDSVRAARSADHLRDAEDALRWIVDDLADRTIERRNDEVSMATDFPREITRRLMLRLLADRFGKTPDGPAVERTMAVLGSGGTTTIADILARAEGTKWHFRAAPRRRSA